MRSEGGESTFRISGEKVMPSENSEANFCIKSQKVVTEGESQ